MCICDMSCSLVTVHACVHKLHMAPLSEWMTCPSFSLTADSAQCMFSYFKKIFLGWGRRWRGSHV